MTELMMKTAEYELKYKHFTCQLFIYIISEFHICDKASTSFELQFLRSPVEFLTTPKGFLRGVKLEINELEVSLHTFLEKY